MVSDRDCINLSDIAYLDLDISRYRDNPLDKIFFKNPEEKNYSIKDEFENSNDDDVKKFVKQLKNFTDYYLPTLKKYKLIAVSEANNTDYYGIACINGSGEVVLANRGTSSLLDGLNDAWMATGNLPPQVDSAFDFYKKVRSAAQKSYHSSNITLTGHSLGGSLATFQMLKFYDDGYLKSVKTFEEYGVLFCAFNVASIPDLLTTFCMCKSRKAWIDRKLYQLL